MGITIRRCTAGDIADVLQFIDQHWKAGHALVTCPSLLNWQHRDADGRGYSFILARRDNAIVGILGYIATRRFDPALADDNVIWLTTWKVREDANIAGLGLALLQALTKSERHVAIGAIGLNPATTPIYEALGYRVGQLQHYVRPNARVSTFALAALTIREQVTPAPFRTPIDMRRVNDERLRTLTLIAEPSSTPRKTPEYFRTRYARHPIYSYVVTALVDAGEPAGLLAVRVAEHGGRRALRIVDFLGSDDALASCGTALQLLLEETDAEYADIYNVGIDPELLKRAGFRCVDPDGPEIVPDHFEPFEPRNIRLWYSLKGSSAPVLFKGDADQDRPNRGLRTSV